MEKRKSKEIDWDLVFYGKRNNQPIVTFSPGKLRRHRWIDLLTRPPKTSGFTMLHRKRLEELLGRHFALIYTRYRRQIQKNYRTPYGDEKRHCVLAAKFCIVLSVTPYQLIKYWHERIGNFTGMSFPPVSFLSKHGRVDEVSLNIGTDGKIRKSKQKKSAGDAHHSFSDTSRLHGDLRSGLTKAGFDMSKWNDRFLMSIQSIAEDMRAGHTDTFVPQSMKRMVRWAAKNLDRGEHDGR